MAGVCVAEMSVSKAGKIGSAVKINFFFKNSILGTLYKKEKKKENHFM